MSRPGAAVALLLDADLSPATKVRLGERLADRVRHSGGRLPVLTPAFAGLDAGADESGALMRL